MVDFNLVEVTISKAGEKPQSTTEGAFVVSITPTSAGPSLYPSEIDGFGKRDRNTSILSYQMKFY